MNLFLGSEGLSSSSLRLHRRTSCLLLSRRLLGSRSLRHPAGHLLGDGCFRLACWSGLLNRRGFSRWRGLLGRSCSSSGGRFLGRRCRSFSWGRLPGARLGSLVRWGLTASGRRPLLTPVEKNIHCT